MSEPLWNGTIVPQEGDDHELEYLRKISDEYHVTLQVVAVLIERFLKLAGQTSVVITDDQLADAPDLIGHRDEGRRRIRLTVTR